MRVPFVLLCASVGFAQQIQIQPVRGNIYMLTGAGANITVSIGPEGVLLVDSGSAQMSDRVLAAIQQLSDKVNAKGAPVKPIRYILNTNVDADHTGGNEKLAEAGKTFTGGNVAGNIADAAEGAAVLAHENVLKRLSDAKVPTRAEPTDTYLRDYMKLSHYFNGEGVQLIYQSAAHTDGDSIVWFRGSDVISTGDIFSTTSYPVIDLKRGGNIEGVIEGLNRILDLAFPEFRLEGGTMVVPGHGRLCDSADVAYYRDMVTIIRDRVKDLMKKGMTLAQIKDAKPTRDYDSRYATRDWTADMFVEAVYRSLTFQ
jgi:glyoxylase-like metal-dependent hydrolase (beta-lactamase superfamily II)